RLRSRTFTTDSTQRGVAFLLPSALALPESARNPTPFTNNFSLGAGFLIPFLPPSAEKPRKASVLPAKTDLGQFLLDFGQVPDDQAAVGGTDRQQFRLRAPCDRPDDTQVLALALPGGGKQLFGVGSAVAVHGYPPIPFRPNRDTLCYTPEEFLALFHQRRLW